VLPPVEEIKTLFLSLGSSSGKDTCATEELISKGSNLELWSDMLLILPAIAI
jgi:hypothetical protein